MERKVERITSLRSKFTLFKYLVSEKIRDILPNNIGRQEWITAASISTALITTSSIIQQVETSQPPVVVLMDSKSSVTAPLVRENLLSPLTQEVSFSLNPPNNRITFNPENARETKKVDSLANWYKLLGTGMKVEQEAEGAIKRFNKAKAEGKDFDQASELATIEVKGNVFGFIDEYLKRRHVLTTNYKLLADGRVAHADSDVALLDVISKQERMGKVWEAFSEIEKFIKRAPVGSIAFYTSPPGISGMKEKDGKDHKYFDSQTFTIQVIAKKQFRVITFVSDMSIEQNLKFLETFGENVEDLRQIEDPYRQQSEIVGRVVKLFPSDGRRPDARDLLGQFKEVIGSDVIRTYETEGKNGVKSLHKQTYSQALAKIAEIEANEYQIKDQKVILEISRMSKLLKQVLQSEGENQQELLERVIGEAVLRIKRLLEGKTLTQISSLPTGSFDVVSYLRRQDNELAKFYKEDIRQVRAMAGCAGGGLSLSFGSTFLASSSLGFSSSTQGSSESSSVGAFKFTEKKHCAVCNHYNPCMPSCEKCGGKVN